MEKEKKQKHSIFCCFTHNKKRKVKDKSTECIDNQNSTVNSQVTETNKNNIDNNTTTKNEEQFTTELNANNNINDTFNNNILIAEPAHSIHSNTEQQNEQYINFSQIDCNKIIFQDIITSNNSVSNTNTNNIVNIDNNDNTNNKTFTNNINNISKTYRNISFNNNNINQYNTYSRVKTCVQEPISIPFTTNIFNDVIHNKDNNNNNNSNNIHSNKSSNTNINNIININEGNDLHSSLCNIASNNNNNNHITPSPTYHFSLITPTTSLPKHSTTINHNQPASPLILTSNRTDPHVKYIPHTKSKFNLPSITPIIPQPVIEQHHSLPQNEQDEANEHTDPPLQILNEPPDNIINNESNNNSSSNNSLLYTQSKLSPNYPHSVVSSCIMSTPNLNDSCAISNYTDAISCSLNLSHTKPQQQQEQEYNETEFEITNENGEGFKAFIETPRSNNMTIRRNRDYFGNIYLRNIDEKIHYKNKEIKALTDKTNKLISTLQTYDEENQKYKRWIEKEQTESEVLRQMLNFLLKNKS